LVDVGSGTGALLRMFEALAVRAVGVESDPVPLAISRERGLDVREGNAGQLPFEDGSVDVLTAFDVIEHVPDDVAAVAEFRRVLRPGAVAIVSVPAYMWLWSGHDVIHGHQRRYTKTRLQATLSRAGFEVTSAGYFNSFLLPLAVAQRLSLRLLRGRAESDLKPVAPRLNATLLRVLSAEEPGLLRGGFPAGLSVFATARRPV
jgi:SAM-dependent methyltransferase